jgi:peroxiredoxin
MKKNYLLLFTLALLIFFPAAYAPAQSNAPDFSLKDLQGNVFQLSQQRGKPVLIFFGATWCPSCRNELPAYKEIYETYNKRGLEVIYIDIMEPREKIVRFAKANSITYRILLDENGAIADNYAVVGIPTLFLIDKTGKIITATHTTDELPLKKLFPAKK